MIPIVDRIEGLVTEEEFAAFEAQQRVERETAEAERKAASEAQDRAEQTRLAGLYQRAGQSLGNLRNTT